MKIDLEQLLEFFEEKGDKRSVLLHYAVIQRIRNGKREGNLEDLLGLRAPGAGHADGFLEYRLRVRNNNLRKAVYYIIKHEMLGEHAACGFLAKNLKRFRGQYARIVDGRSCLESPLIQWMFEACWHDPDAFDLKQGALFAILFP